MNLLKVLNPELKSPYKNFTYEIGKEYHCDRFDTNPRKDCANGFYAVDIEGLPYAYRYGKEIWHVEVGGKSVEYNQYKRRYETIKILEKANLYDIKRQATSLREELGYKLDEAIFPIHPLRRKAKQVTDREVELLNNWGLVRDSVCVSVWASVRDSVWASVWESVGDSVEKSVRDSVWESVGDSIWDLARAYSSSIFFGVKEWKYIDHEPGINPYQSGIDLWHSGFVPSFDEKTWRLHSGKTAEVVYEQPRRGT